MENKQSQEIDMLDIMDRMREAAYYCYKSICSFITSILRLTYNYKVLFLIVFVLAGALAYYSTTGNRRIYKGDIALKINAGNSYLIAEMMSELNNFVKHTDSNGLAEALGINEEDANKIAFINSYYFIAINQDSSRSIIDYKEKYDIEDTTNTRVKDKIIVSLGLKDRNLYSKMQNVLTGYLNNNEYLKTLHAKRLNNLLERERIINCDLNRLDSLQDKQFFKSNKNEIYLTNITELRSGKQDLFYNDKQNLLDKKVILENELAGNTNIVTIISPFHPTAVSNESFLQKFLCFGCCLYILFLVIATLLKNWNKIGKFLGNN